MAPRWIINLSSGMHLILDISNLDSALKEIVDCTETALYEFLSSSFRDYHLLVRSIW